MRKLVFTSAFLLLVSFPLIAQWLQQNSGTTKGLYTIYFLNENLGWIGGEDGTILKTTDEGENWFSQSISTLDNIRSIFFTDSLNGWIALYEWIPFRHGSIYHTTDGGTSWYSQISVYDLAILSLFFIDSQRGWAVGTNGMILKTSNGGNSWQYNFIADGWLFSERFANNNTGWTVGDLFGQVAKTTNGGNSWFMQYVPTFYNLIDVYLINDLTGWAVGVNGAIINTNNGGMNWLTQSSGVTNELRDVHFIDQMNGWVAGFSGVILHSINGGVSWNQQNTGTSNDLYAVAFTDELNGWVVGNLGMILRTNNGGVPVELITFNFVIEEDNVVLSWSTATETNNHGFKIYRDGNEIGFIPGAGTITEPRSYSYTDLNIKRGSHKYELIQIDLDGSNNKIGELEITIDNIASVYLLEQNYPNPFNPITTIKYSLAQNGYLKLAVYNSLGEMMAVLEDGFKESGNYQVEFNALNLPSGIYYYTLVSGDFISTKKMILLR
jgi:photosystem II stability/assembly factor-like uncharacterized protein